MSRGLELLGQLVAIPSVNPTGRDASGPEFGEGRLSDFLESFFHRLGVACERTEVAPGRANVVARLDVGAKWTVLLDAHQDTVSADGMTVEPFTPAVRDGRLYGRGACDVKGGMAAMLTAFEWLVRERPAGAANVILSCTCDEESTMIGIDALVNSWADPGRSDAAIVAEPTGLDVAVAHKGTARWQVVTRGRACHSSAPDRGVNAIYRMAHMVAALEAYAAELPAAVPPHPLYGPATVSVGRVEGGVGVNTVPDRCTVLIDRRLLPGEDARAAIDHAQDFLSRRAAVPFEFLRPWHVSPPLPDGPNAALAERLLAQVRSVAGPRRAVGVPYGTHAARTASAGVPSVVFGPGCIEQAHTADEWIEAAQLGLASDVYFNFCAAG